MFDNILFFYLFPRHSKSGSSEKGAQSKINHPSILVEKWHRHSVNQNYKTIVVDKIAENFNGRIKSTPRIQTKHNYCQQTSKIGAKIW